MQARATGSPNEALAWIQADERFDLGILDMHMPEMDGVTLARAIRGHPAGAALPLVLFTSLGRREARAEEEGFAAYLHKPIKPSQLFDALVSVLAEQPVHVPERGVGAGRARSGPGRPPPAAHPPGRGQRGQPEGRAPAPRADGLPGRRGRQRARGHRRRRAADLRRGADGRADAGARRLRGLPRDQPALAGRAPAADRRHDRQRHAGRPRAVRGGRHGRLRREADPGRGAGRRAGALPRRADAGHARARAGKAARGRGGGPAASEAPRERSRRRHGHGPPARSTGPRSTGSPRRWAARSSAS